ncbi:MAG: YgiQ family radical SAM protein [Candidatus Omnitrophica bacterium]|nr:YgiQ family radical SAM protein [Candidatus Omnitrophota bacterium]
MSHYPQSGLFLPVSREDMRERGWVELDVILISGDAYVDHPSFGAALIGRLLESRGYRVGIIAQPDWRSASDFQRLGRPRLFFGITAGNTDSMIANYTANKKIRSDDEYAPGNRAGLRPDRAVIVYANRVREFFGAVPIVIGGIEASLRRLSHYDYWDDQVRRSILGDSRADILVYGMGERAVMEIARRLQEGAPAGQLDGIRGTAVIRRNIAAYGAAVILPSYEQTASDHRQFNRAFMLAAAQMNPASGKVLGQQQGHQWVVHFPPAMPLSRQEFDSLYELPYMYRWHPDYTEQGGVKSLETVQFSLTVTRGCCGECSFCSLSLHQGRIVQSRSAASVAREAERMAARPDFRGTITDVGGPTANLYGARCARWQQNRFCEGRKCLVPEKCERLDPGYAESLVLLRRLRKIPGVKHVFIGSGVRYDLLLADEAQEYLRELCRHHISGLLKIAPEHCANEVLRLMHKPDFQKYERFVRVFQAAAQAADKKIFLVNYFISSHPGCSLAETLKLALYLAKRKVRPEQIQDFIPSPMTLSTCMYYTGRDPRTGKPVCVARGAQERRQQRALIQYANPKNRALVLAALSQLGMEHTASKLFVRKPPPGGRPAFLPQQRRRRRR